MKTIVIVSAVLHLLAAAVLGAQESGYQSPLNEGKCELDISVGLPTVMTVSVANSLSDAVYGASKDFFDALLGGGQSDDGLDRGRYVMYPMLRIEYGYNVLEWLSVGGGVNYSCYRRPLTYSGTGIHAWDEVTHMANVSVCAKFYWFNRPYVRMYSAIGAGIGFLTANSGYEEDKAEVYATKVIPSLDLRLFGITVGRRLYGRFEFGTSYGVVTAGIGYRF